MYVVSTRYEVLLTEHYKLVTRSLYRIRPNVSVPIIFVFLDYGT
jgi:hypothetical protein